MTYNESVSLLSTVHIRATRKKSAILQVIADAVNPLDAHEIHVIVKESLPMDLATVYRTLTLFRKKGLVRPVTDESGVLFYEFVSGNDRVHPHFKCVECNQYFCLPSLSREEQKILSKAASRYRVNDIEISMRGVCDECNGD